MNNEQELDEQEDARRTCLSFMVIVANTLYGMSKAERQGCMRAIANLISTLDTLPADLEPEAIYSPDSDRLIVTFNADPQRDPLVVQF